MAEGTHGPSREAEHAAQDKADSLGLSVEDVTDEQVRALLAAAFPVIRRDVALGVAGWLRDQVTAEYDETTVLYRPAFQLVADEVEREFGGTDG